MTTRRQFLAGAGALVAFPVAPDAAAPLPATLVLAPQVQNFMSYGVNDLARPLIVPPPLFAAMKREGLSIMNVRPNTMLPRMPD